MCNTGGCIGSWAGIGVNRAYKPGAVSASK